MERKTYLNCKDRVTDFADIIPAKFVIAKDTLIECIKANKYTVKELAPNPCWIDTVTLSNTLSQEGQEGITVLLSGKTTDLYVNVHEFIKLCEYYSKVVKRETWDGDCHYVAEQRVYDTIALIKLAEMLAEPVFYAMEDDMAHLCI